MKSMRKVFSLVLDLETNSFPDNINLVLNGVNMISPDGDVVTIVNRIHDINLDSVGGGIVRATIDIVNETEEIEERIDYMLDEEYELQPLVDVKVKSSGKAVSWTINWRNSCQTEKMMDVNMAPGVKESLDFLTDSAIEFSPEFMSKLVKDMNDGNLNGVMDFITKLGNLY